ncbi:MAG: electron transfer flavoprotein subunit alpha/FixB family protein [Syntrophaceae bacterium]|nr:electron transfer flavoprotein subunit alpha/FixB family protein [Syntrophaceae bacterium]
MTEPSPSLKNIETVAVVWHSGESPLPGTFETISAARLLSAAPAAETAVVTCGVEPEAAARMIAAETGLPVFALRGAALDPACGEDAVLALASLLRELDPLHVVLAHDARGADLAPALAIRLGAACITAVEVFALRDGRRTFLRSVCRGRMRMEIAPETSCAVLTVLPGVTGGDFAGEMCVGTGGEAATDLVRIRKAVPGRGKIVLSGEKRGEEEGADLEEADVIVSAGRGIGREENLDLIRRMAGLFRNAAVGASRPVCDQGWLGYRYQVGLTGRTVTPDLYVACGISGTSQHLAGMKGSRCIVAVNRDPDAPIFRVAHYGIVEDLTVFLPLFIEAAKI